MQKQSKTFNSHDKLWLIQSIREDRIKEMDFGTLGKDKITLDKFKGNKKTTLKIMQKYVR